MGRSSMGRINWPALLIVALFTYGCVNTLSGQAADADPSVETIHAGTVCTGGPAAPRAVWIDTHQNLKNHWQRMHSHRLGGLKPSFPQVEWRTHGMVLVHMGQKFTGGYGLQLARSRARLQDGIAFVSVNWVEPPDDAIVAQVITTPCLLLKIRRGAYHSVVIVDQSGRRRAKVDLP